MLRLILVLPALLLAVGVPEAARADDICDIYDGRRVAILGDVVEIEVDDEDGLAVLMVDDLECGEIEVWMWDPTDCEQGDLIDLVGIVDDDPDLGWSVDVEDHECF